MTNHTERLLVDLVHFFDRYISERMTATQLQSALYTISEEFDNSVDSELRKNIALLPERIEEIEYTSTKPNYRKQIANEIEKVRENILSIYPKLNAEDRTDK